MLSATPVRSYVRHLPEEDGEHGKSLARLCTYPYWPSHSLPRLVKRLVDHLIQSYLAVTAEGELRVNWRLVHSEAVTREGFCTK